MTTINETTERLSEYTTAELLDTIADSAAEAKHGDPATVVGYMFIVQDAAGELRHRVAALEAEVSQLRIRAETREAQLRHLQGRLNRLGEAETDVQDVLDGLRESGAAVDAKRWDGFGEAEVCITVAEGRTAEVDAAMLAIGLYPVGVPVPGPDGMAHWYSTDGTTPWEASDEAVVPRGGVGC